MTQTVKLSFSHVGVFVNDLEKMVDFYTRVLGLVVSDRDVRDDGSEIAFLTGDPREHHQVVFATGRPADLKYNMIQQISFRAPSLAALRDTYRKLTKEPILELGPVTHGNAISTYFRDPEGNRLEVFIDMPWHVPQPFRIPLEMDKSDQELLSFVEDSIRATPGFVSRAQWTAEIAAKLSHSHKH
ncbi:MAG: glyoxalase [Xanthobacteraceae bacterium]|nr:glyoxalase [Xanthobacteraceae bacterium]